MSHVKTIRPSQAKYTDVVDDLRHVINKTRHEDSSIADLLEALPLGSTNSNFQSKFTMEMVSRYISTIITATHPQIDMGEELQSCQDHLVSCVADLRCAAQGGSTQENKEFAEALVSKIAQKVGVVLEDHDLSLPSANKSFSARAMLAQAQPMAR